ncbi:MAG: hypothetical protein LBG58_16160 [Planctomycetaceae bacterium]|nr:hypothetical protein [Planctomycetaceae bacterium]
MVVLFAISPKVVYQKVGNLSPKGCVGDSRLVPVSRQQSVSKPVGTTNYTIESDSLLPIGNATVGENSSAKGCLPLESNKNNQYHAVCGIVGDQYVVPAGQKNEHSPRLNSYS